MKSISNIAIKSDHESNLVWYRPVFENVRSDELNVSSWVGQTFDIAFYQAWRPRQDIKLKITRWGIRANLRVADINKLFLGLDHAVHRRHASRLYTLLDHEWKNRVLYKKCLEIFGNYILHNPVLTLRAKNSQKLIRKNQTLLKCVKAGSNIY